MRRGDHALSSLIRRIRSPPELTSPRPTPSPFNPSTSERKTDPQKLSCFRQSRRFQSCSLEKARQAASRWLFRRWPRSPQSRLSSEAKLDPTLAARASPNLFSAGEKIRRNSFISVVASRHRGTRVQRQLKIPSATIKTDP